MKETGTVQAILLNKLLDHLIGCVEDEDLKSALKDDDDEGPDEAVDDGDLEDEDKKKRY